MKNIIKNLLTPADRDALDDLLSQIENILAGKLAALDEEERRRFGSVKEQNKLLINKVAAYRENSPSLSSPDVNWDEFKSDYDARSYLESYISRLSSIVHQMESTKILHDYDNHQDSLRDYNYSKYKKDVGEPGFEEKVARLKQFFSRTGTGSSNKTEKTDQNIKS